MGNQVIGHELQPEFRRLSRLKMKDFQRKFDEYEQLQAESGFGYGMTKDTFLYVVGCGSGNQAQEKNDSDEESLAPMTPRSMIGEGSQPNELWELWAPSYVNEVDSQQLWSAMIVTLTDKCKTNLLSLYKMLGILMQFFIL